MLQQMLSTAIHCISKLHSVCYGTGWVSIALGIAIHCLYIASQAFIKVIIQRGHDFTALTVSCQLHTVLHACGMLSKTLHSPFGLP